METTTETTVVLQPEQLEYIAAHGQANTMAIIGVMLVLAFFFVGGAIATVVKG